MPYKTFTNGEIFDEDDANTYLMKQANITCTSGSRPSDPVDGMEIYETDTATKRRWFSGQNAWVIWPPQVVEAAETTGQSVTSTGYSVGSPPCDITFAAPPSGKALIMVTGNIAGYSSQGGIYLSFQIRLNNASGTIFNDAFDLNALYNQGVQNLRATYTRYIGNFTPGQVYYIRLMHRIADAGQTGSIIDRRLTVVPLAN
ncbi:hypothetical protein [Actinoplanes sp. N902-109]|uniref:hypothetical protein n=1 Tax=Actinoplanes sp. (strain N902-109) TaxID=649831 RepID=UPI00032956DD|nr:hypothetical protein [Actinoplanes sp. N902-109]AGL13886.1 hypothetical protein L083_0376 [Actinoplanes sp. N902-109]